MEQKHADMYDQGQPYEVAENMWGGPEKLKKALHDGIAKKVEKMERILSNGKDSKLGRGQV